MFKKRAEGEEEETGEEEGNNETQGTGRGGEKTPRPAVIEVCRWRTEGRQWREREREISVHLKATGEQQAEEGKWAVRQL